MKGLGSGDFGEWTFLDLLSIISFIIGLENLEMNISQENLDNQTQELDKELHKAVADIHFHLQEQDKKINQILEVLKNDR